MGWEAFPGGYVGKIMDSKYPPRIILKSSGKNSVEEREFIIRHEEFDNWLYWIIRGILKYSNAEIQNEYLKCLSLKRRRKVITRLDLKRFDMSHEVFIAISESLQHAIDLKQRTPKTPTPLGFHPDIVSGPKVAGRTRQGMAFSKVKKKLGSGGSETVIYEIDRLLQPILERKKNTTPQLKRPAEPIAVKVPKHFDFDEDGTYKDLVREARIMAAIGLHNNIIRMIDAHLLSESRLYLFMEMGQHDLGAYRLDKAKTERKPAPEPQVVRRYALGILAGITHMHQRRIYHLDMKPANVLVCSDVPKIIDFGLAKTKVIDPKEEMFNETWSAYGTVLYIPPESWTNGAISNENHLAKRDSYAVGMTLIEALLGPNLNVQRPNPGTAFNENPQKVLRRIKHWQKKLKEIGVVAKLKKRGLMGVAKVASQLIEADPEKRIFVEHALELLREDIKKLKKRNTANPGRGTGTPSRGNPKANLQKKTSSASWKCRNCKRSFTYKPMRCTCNLLVHPDGDPLFVRV